MVTGTKPHLHIVRSSVPAYQLSIVLTDSEPLIWRQLLVSGSVTLATLHVVFQHAMGWRGSHQHAFVIGDTCYGQPDPDYPETVPVIDEQTVNLTGLVKVGQRFSYLYDYGDDWQHEVTVEAVLPADEAPITPHCIAGANACPPEDVGGIPGYEDFLGILGDPEHYEYQQTLAWCGGAFDPDAFDLIEMNRRLAGLKL